MGHKTPTTNATDNDIRDYYLNFLDDSDAYEGNETDATADFIKDIAIFKKNLTVLDTECIIVKC